MEMLWISYTCRMKYSTCWRKQSLSFKCVWHKHYFIFTTLKHGTCIQNYIMKIFLISHSILHPLFFEIKIMLLLSNSSDWKVLKKILIYTYSLFIRFKMTFLRQYMYCMWSERRVVSFRDTKIHLIYLIW